MEPFDFKPQKSDINLNILSFIKNDFSSSTVIEIPDEKRIINPDLFFMENLSPTVLNYSPEKKCI